MPVVFGERQVMKDRKTTSSRTAVVWLHPAKKNTGIPFSVSFPSVMVVGPTDRRSVKTHCRTTTITSGAFGSCLMSGGSGAVSGTP